MSFTNTIFHRTYAFDENETWEGCADRVTRFVTAGSKVRSLQSDLFKAISAKKFMPGGRYLYSSGRKIPQINNCVLLRAEDSREGWGDLAQKCTVTLATGAGVGVEYSDIREKGAPIKGYGGTASGPVSLMQMINEISRHILAGGKRRSALWAGLNWNHSDIEQFINVKNWSTQIRACKEASFNFPAPLDMTNISVGLDDEFFHRIQNGDQETYNLYYRICKSMLKTGEPGFSVNTHGRDRENLRNACTEIVSDTSGDICNLGSINLARIDSLDELARITEIATHFLYLGTFVGWMAHPDYDHVRSKYRRIGLGLMGLHEWCLKHEIYYGATTALGNWLQVWKDVSDRTADKCASLYNTVRPIAVRSIAPTGTIGILGETTTGIEPIFCVAYKRRFLGNNDKWKFSYIVDPTAQRLIELGIPTTKIEDSYQLAFDVERRIQMQQFVQRYVDQSISSTINLPAWGEPGNNNAKHFAQTLLKYLPDLRGITVYPDGARAGQPITPLSYEEAMKHRNVIFEETDERCSGGVCGI